MPIAAIQFYDVIVAVHIIAVVLGFGPTFAYPALGALAEGAHPRSVPFYLRAIQRVERTLVWPGLIVVIAAGIYLVEDGGWEYSAGWVSFGMTAALVLLALALFFFRPQSQKALELAERDIAVAGETGEVALSEDYQAVSKRIAMMGGIASLIVVATIFVMSTKPF